MSRQGKVSWAVTGPHGPFRIYRWSITEVRHPDGHWPIMTTPTFEGSRVRGWSWRLDRSVDQAKRAAVVISDSLEGKTTITHLREGCV